MLLPDRTTVSRLLRAFRALERTVLARPHDPAARRRLEDTTYTLCVLMGERTAGAAVRAAERYVARPAPPAASLPAAAAAALAPAVPPSAARVASDPQPPLLRTTVLPTPVLQGAAPAAPALQTPDLESRGSAPAGGVPAE
ncbi:hypothetical protein SLA_0324 [Streptomyces laurentii]|uniref:DUF5133 domain-containing protein n=1 Tax=Streptomyces laurentii TaxID=39478 RepID=A0A160NSG8_STRLU|nr:hypothetical protein SLA_0324 [Streptomyces laurentii]